ncbi:PREDICTED: exosome complex component CSL4 isoform X2 [Nanorana parkeri]|uniref:exosome complex component CSL4 isoform X2 n=1 Tax=Nanorana parkeri TaxID=125878 RepID=UPI0008546B13|nr:PREDICTED: exosome complex component CSL4 isoform X2 [Nanorana parkeri]
MAPVRWCVPGERLCSLEDCAPGHGTYCKHGYIFASLAGYVFKTSDNGLVMSINPRFAKVQIMYVGSRALKNTFKGTIRREDIRATEKDKVEVYKCVRPGDIVIGKVISLGDSQSSYLLSTAENELGVVVAHSEAGATMVPISWCEMQCPKTHIKEPRKVARVQPEFLQT